MANELVQQLIDAGVHFGHRASRWNPKMAPYIYGRKNLIHIIDIRETVRGLLRAKKYLSGVAAGGSLILFVGTKRQAAADDRARSERCGMPYVSERWLGGALTNFRTIRSRMGRLEELETIRGSERDSTYSKKMQSALNSRVSQDVPQPEWHADDEPACPSAWSWSTPTRKRTRFAKRGSWALRTVALDRYRLRSGSGRPADSR